MNRQRYDDGFTLIELMIATVVFTFGLVAVLTSVMTMFGQQRYDEYDAITSNYMNFILEDLQAASLDDGQISRVTSYEDPNNDVQLFVDNGAAIAIPELGPVTLELEQGAAGPIANSVEIRILLTYTAYDGRQVTKRASRILTY